MAACSLETAMLGAAGAGRAAALITVPLMAPVLADHLGKCHTGLSTAMPLVASMLTQALAALLVAALADELGHEAVGADVDRDAARRAPVRPVPALGPDLPLARRHGRRGRGGRKKNEVERQVEVSSVARALWKNHSAE